MLVAELLGNVLGGRARHLDPGLGEKTAGSEDERQVEDGVDGVVEDLGHRLGGRDVVRETANRHRVASSGSVDILPPSEKTDEEVARVTLVEKLGEEVDVRHESGLEDDGDVGGVEELDGVRALLAAVLLVLDGEVDTEAWK